MTNDNSIFQQVCDWRRTPAATVEQRRHVDAPCQGMDALNNTVRNRRRRPSTPSRRRRCTATTRTTAARTTITSSSSHNSNTSNCCCNSNSMALSSNNNSRTRWSDLGPRRAVTTITRCPGTIGDNIFQALFATKIRIDIVWNGECRVFGFAVKLFPSFLVASVCI